jgi:hypothetical protein
LTTDPYVINWKWEIPDPNKVTWKDNVPFFDTMKIGPVANARSYHSCPKSTFCEATSITTGKHYPIYNSDLAELISSVVLDHGEVPGTWAFKRCSGKISIYLVSR